MLVFIPGGRNITEINFEFKKFSQTKIINYKFHSNISGMNSIFRAMYHAKDIINSYDYVCFVEDDNFIFPDKKKYINHEAIEMFKSALILFQSKQFSESILAFTSFINTFSVPVDAVGALGTQIVLVYKRPSNAKSTV